MFVISGSLPNNTDVELWADSNSMNLLFNLSYPAPQNTTVTIIAATLRLYKFAQVGSASLLPQSNFTTSPKAKVLKQNLHLIAYTKTG